MGIHAGAYCRKTRGFSKGRGGVVTARAVDAPLATGRPSAELTVGFLALGCRHGAADTIRPGHPKYVFTNPVEKLSQVAYACLYRLGWGHGGNAFSVATLAQAASLSPYW